MRPILHQYSRRRQASNAEETPLPPMPNVNHEPNRVVYEDEEDEQHITEDVEEDNAEGEEKDDDDETGALLDFSSEQDCGDAGCCGSSKHSRSEKKSRKAMLKLGMKPVSGVHQVTIKKSENLYFHITEPEVFKSPTAESYVIFGAAKLQNMSPTLQTHVKHARGQCPKHGSSAMAHGENEVEDDTGLDPRDIELIMSQTGVSRAKAIKALKAADNDIVTAIMEYIN